MSTCTLVCTMGGQAQVVTLALDDLLAKDVPIDDVVVLHLSSQADPRVTHALTQLYREFDGGRYAGAPCRLRAVPVCDEGSPLDDICDEATADATWQAVHALIAELKAQRRCLHLCIAGGRRIIGLMAMSAAMLHFDHLDRLWHLYTPRTFLDRARDGAILHAGPDEGVRLIQVPMMPWGAYFPTLRALAQGSSQDAIALRARMMDAGEHARCRQVLDALTERQAEVLRAFADRQSPQDVAESLCISLKTVDTHKTAILAQCRIAWGLPEQVWLDYHFLRERFGSFFSLPV